MIHKWSLIAGIFAMMFFKQAVLSLPVTFKIREAAGGKKVEISFTEPAVAMVNARAWDQTHHEWVADADAGRLFYDGIHRFLLLRFPESAELIADKLREGYAIESAELRLTYDGQEWGRVEGYSSRNWSLIRKGVQMPNYSARVYALNRNWMDDPELGPTWNAYINGSGYWRAGGARTAGVDRHPEPLGVAGVSSNNINGVINVTDMLTDALYGETIGHRLRAMADHGFIVQRHELSNLEFGSYTLATGAARVYVKEPTLIVTLRKSDNATLVVDLPPAKDVRKLAATLKSAGGDGEPANKVPDNLDELVAAAKARQQVGMPDWMIKHVEDLKQIPQSAGYGPIFQNIVLNLESGDRERWKAAVDDILSRAPGYALGHQRIEFSLPLYLYPDLLPPVVHEHLRQDFIATMSEDVDPYRLYKITSMGTLNHMSNARPTWLLGAQVANMDSVVEAAHYGISLLNRQMIYSDGYSTEHGDSYYRGITIAPLQAGAKFIEDPFVRLKADLMVEKLRVEDIATYHPGLKKRVSRISRRAEGLNQMVLSQSPPDAMLHTLSREGTLIHLEDARASDARERQQIEIDGVPAFDLASTPPTRMALMAPWGDAWEAHNIDDKTLPFRADFASHVFGWIADPVHITSYLGENYGIGTEELPNYAMTPTFAAWRRTAEPVDHLHDKGIMILEGRLNEEPFSGMDKTPFGILQHNNKLVWAVKTPERHFVVAGANNFPKGVDKGLTSFKAMVGIVAHGAENLREVHINGEPVKAFPAKAKFGDRITIREGVTYIGLIPIAATDMGRDAEVVIEQNHPHLTISAYIFNRAQPILGDDDAMWSKLVDATAAWALEMGDVAEHGSFDAFQKHFNTTQATARWEGNDRVLHVAYNSGEDKLEMGFRTDWERVKDLWHDQRTPSEVFAYQHVNGEYPWFDRGLEMDHPLGQMGVAPVLSKGGAELHTLEGQMALLRIEPITGVYRGINPFFEPTPFELRTPEGAVVKSDGPMGMGRVTLRPGKHTLSVDYQLPPAGGNPGIEKFIAERKGFFPRGISLAEARETAARALLLKGLGPRPVVILNGEPVSTELETVEHEGETWFRVPIVR